MSVNAPSSDSDEPDSRFLGRTSDGTAYSGASDGATLHPAAISRSGGGQPHENRSPFLTLNYCIAMQGIYPSRE